MRSYLNGEREPGVRILAAADPFDRFEAYVRQPEHVAPLRQVRSSVRYLPMQVPELSSTSAGPESAATNPTLNE